MSDCCTDAKAALIAAAKAQLAVLEPSALAVNVPPCPDVPVADFTATPHPSNPLMITFGNLSTGATTYVWDLGNGTVGAGAFELVHTYPAAGEYTVVLYARNGGLVGAAVKLITVLAPTPPADPLPGAFTQSGPPNNDVAISGMTFEIFSWNAADRAETYTLRVWRDSPAEEPLLKTGIVGTFYEVSALEAAEFSAAIYQWEVKAVNADGSTTASNAPYNIDVR